jgi:hypothetical protein
MGVAKEEAMRFIRPGLLVLRGPSARAKRHRTKEQIP